MMNISNMRLATLLNNVLVEVCEKTCIGEQPELYEAWLKEEIGFTDKELKALKELNMLPIPMSA